MRPHGHARVDRNSPRAWGICDRCGFLYNLEDLQWQYVWAGTRTANTNLRVCNKCTDVLQEQLRVFVLPADPVPVANPRVERANLYDNPISAIGTSFGTLTQGGGLNAAFDSNTNKPFAWCAISYVSISGANNTVGRNWGNSPITASSFTIMAPNNARFLGSGATAYAFQGANNPLVFNTIASGTTAGTIGEVITVTVSPTQSYQYHQIVLTGDGTTSVGVAQLQINQAG